MFSDPPLMVDGLLPDASGCGDRVGSAQTTFTDRIPRVSILRRSISPGTVCRRVRPIVIDALDGHVVRRPSAHVADEILERLPRCTDTDPAATVASVLLIARIVATVEHRFPHAILWNFRQAVAPIASSAPLTREFAVQTAAAPAVAGANVLSDHIHLSPAVATAPPSGPSISIHRSSNDEQATATYPDHVNYGAIPHANASVAL